MQLLLLLCNQCVCNRLISPRGLFAGYRRGTRHMFARPFRGHGLPGLTTYLRTYRLGDIVDIKVRATRSVFSARRARCVQCVARSIACRVCYVVVAAAAAAAAAWRRRHRRLVRAWRAQPLRRSATP